MQSTTTTKESRQRKRDKMGYYYSSYGDGEVESVSPAAIQQHKIEVSNKPIKIIIMLFFQRVF